MQKQVMKFFKSISVTGVVVGTALFCLSLTPSLLPRVVPLQGTLAGVSLVVGYGVGILFVYLWEFLELPIVHGTWKNRLSIFSLIVACLIAIVTLNRITVWQNSIRSLMEMETVDSAYPFRVFWLAIFLAAILLLVVRGILWLSRRASRRVNRIMPRRISIGLGTLLVAVILGALVDGLVVRNVLRAFDETFGELDKLVDDGVAAPVGFSDPDALIKWDEIGRNGKRFLVNGPDRSEIEAFTGRSAKEPVRVYAGFNAGETLEERAKVAVAELVRTGGFERSVLIVATPTGTGWLDPAAVQPVAYLHQGDISIVSMQYSYLPSWLTLMVDPSQSKLAARALFKEVLDHWQALPKEARPRLYLFGLSLGSLGSEASTDLVEMIADPIDGAVWVGPPFASTIWNNVTKSRETGSPQWRPLFRDGSMIRFMTQDGFDPTGFANWGPIRITYLQHPSDPMSFFSTSMAFSKPNWLGEDRGRDISHYFQWFPIVSFLQTGFDIPMATAVPPGYGHNFVPSEYIDAWVSVTQPTGWSAADTIALKRKFENFDGSPL